MASVITEQGDLGLGLWDCPDQVYQEACNDSKDNKDSDKDKKEDK